MDSYKRFQQIKEKKLKFFLPDWDDRVHAGYNFVTDEPTTDRRVYQHEIYDHHNFDGLLVSKTKLEQSKRKFNKIKQEGIHKHLRYNGPVFGDNGAYSYVDEKYPPVDVKELIEYYTTIGIDLAVSLDHLCVPKHKSDWELRKEITIKSAEQFKNIHDSKGYDFVPIGSAQGWDDESYYDSIKQLIDMNYEYIAIGGLSGASTREILQILEYVHPLIKDPDLEVHLFGVARLKHIREFIRLGITSLDSASLIRTSFKGFRKNYFSPDYQPYAAIRIPYASRLRSKDFKNLVNLGLVTKDKLQAFETDLYRMLFEFDTTDKYSVDEVVHTFQLFESLFMRNYDTNRFRYYREMLKAKPWRDCDCRICQELGIEVMIFRGNNRNRRRSFHNTHVFYQILQRILEDPDFSIDDLADEDDEEELDDGQMSLEAFIDD